MAHEKYMINREKYKAIKRFDHKQMEKFCYDIYLEGVTKGREDGYAEGYASAVAEAPKLDAELLEEAILTAIQKTKGIGAVKFEEIKKNLLPVFRKEGMDGRTGRADENFKVDSGTGIPSEQKEDAT